MKKKKISVEIIHPKDLDAIFDTEIHAAFNKIMDDAEAASCADAVGDEPTDDRKEGV